MPAENKVAVSASHTRRRATGWGGTPGVNGLDRVSGGIGVNPDTRGERSVHQHAELWQQGHWDVGAPGVKPKRQIVEGRSRIEIVGEHPQPRGVEGSFRGISAG
jgi:hypothetical protein